MPELNISNIFWPAVAVLEIYTLLRAISREHGVERTLAWVFAILAIPGLGAIAYLLLASPSVKRTTRRKQFAARSCRSSFPETLESHRKEHEPFLRFGTEGTLLCLAASVTGLKPTTGNSVKLLTENDLAFREIEVEIESAQKSIWAEYYIIRKDETGHRFLDLLAQKAREGVEVRLLYDAVGSLRIDTRRLKAIRRNGGKTAVFLPVNPLRRRWAVHLRNHRKMIIVDAQLGFTGGMNVGDEYSGRGRKGGTKKFRDSHLAIHGPAVEDLARTFLEDWSFATGENLSFAFSRSPKTEASSVVAVVPSGPDQEYNASAMLYFSAISSARTRAYLSSPYFIPDEPLIHALVSASLRGVDVRLLLPARSDVLLVGPAARSYYPRLLQAGVRVYEYQPSMLHAKMAVIDGATGIVGSANVDIRSFRLNFELSALIIDPRFSSALEERFLRDFEKSVEITLHDTQRRGFPTRLIQGTARLLSPLL